MTIERLIFDTREEWLAARQHDVTASDAAAVIDEHPHRSWSQLLEYKRHGGEQADTPAMKRGRAMEPAVAVMVGEAHPAWRLQQYGRTPTGKYVYLRDTDYRIGATLDYTEDLLQVAVECKSASPASFVKNYTREIDASEYDPANAYHRGPGDRVAGRKITDHRVLVPPAYVTVQALTQAMLGGLRSSIVACVTGSLYELELYEWSVPRHAGVEARVRDGARRFWMEVEG